MEINENEEDFIWERGGFIESISPKEIESKMISFHMKHDEEINYNCKICNNKISLHNRDWHNGMCDNCFNKEVYKIDNSDAKIYKEEKINNINMLPGDLKGSPDESFSPSDALIFIDAGFVSKLSGHFGNGKYLSYDLKSFSENLCRKQKLNCRQIFYYTAPPFQSPTSTKSEEKKREGYDRFIVKLQKNGLWVREGRCQRLKIDGNFIYNQKAVDILMAMDLTNIPVRFPNVKKIILISSDSDFVPVIKNLGENRIKTILYTYYEKKRDSNFSRSNDLIKSVYKYVLIKKDDFDECPLAKKGSKL